MVQTDWKLLQTLFVLLVLSVIIFVINEQIYNNNNNNPGVISVSPSRQYKSRLSIQKSTSSAIKKIENYIAPKSSPPTQPTTKDVNSDTSLHTSQTPESLHTQTSITDKTRYTFGNLIAPSVVLKFKGGIGNQMFQYACHYALARKNNWPLYIFLPNSAMPKPPNTTKAEELKRRDFVLKDKFNVPFFKENTLNPTWNISGIFHNVNDSALLSGHYPRNRILQQDAMDYCQGEAFFTPYKNEIREILTQRIATEPIQDWIDLIDSKEASVAVHLRRGDFVGLNIAIPISFYMESMDRLTKMLNTVPTFFVFTDDVNYVDKEFFGNKTDGLSNHYEIYLVSQPKLNTLQEFFLMTRCKHDIIPNSSFGWWAAYLNRNPKKIVFAAHHQVAYFERVYGSPVQREFFKWSFRHIYYPYEWYTFDTFV